jgi:hypothetical protein
MLEEENMLLLEEEHDQAEFSHQLIEYSPPTVKVEFDHEGAMHPVCPRAGRFKKGHWEESERINYHIFLEIWHKQFENKKLRRIDKIFKLMSRFVGTRQPDQCRSHHQKM